MKGPGLRVLPNLYNFHLSQIKVETQKQGKGAQIIYIVNTEKRLHKPKGIEKKLFMVMKIDLIYFIQLFQKIFVSLIRMSLI